MLHTSTTQDGRAPARGFCTAVRQAAVDGPRWPPLTVNVHWFARRRDYPQDDRAIPPAHQHADKIHCKCMGNCPSSPPELFNRVINCVLTSLHLCVHNDFLKVFGDISQQKFENTHVHRRMCHRGHVCLRGTSPTSGEELVLKLTFFNISGDVTSRRG